MRRFVAKMAKSENQEDHVLKLTAWDYDGPHRSPDFLGQVRLPLADLINSQPDIKATDKNWWVRCSLRESHSNPMGPCT